MKTVLLCGFVKKLSRDVLFPFLKAAGYEVSAMRKIRGFFILNLDPGVDFQEYAKSTLQIHSFHLTCKNTSAPGSPHPTSDGGICLVLLIKEEGLLACRVQYIKGDQAPVCKSDDKGVIRLGTAKQRL